MNFLLPPHRSTVVRLALIAVLCCLFNSGCGGSQESSVSGKVTLDGQPLTKGNVSFYPVGGQGTVATGTIRADGSYAVSTGSQAGLPAGDYVATVVATDPPPDDATPGRRITPEIYSRAETSPLKITISAGGNTRPLKLESQ